MHVLIVEDDLTGRRLLSRYLEPYGECDVAISGHEALTTVKPIKKKMFLATLDEIGLELETETQLVT